MCTMTDEYHLLSTQEEFEIAICEYIFDASQQSIKTTGQFTFVLSGGRTPASIFQRLYFSYKRKIDWSKTHFFWLDERCVSSDNADSNFKLANDLLISKLEDVGSVHRMEAEKGPLAAVKYQSDLIEFFGRLSDVKFDLILLGMGDDGHVASLFPEAPELHSTDLVVGTSEKYNGHFRVTLNLEIINSSSKKILMVNNQDKYDILKSRDPGFPINLVVGKTVMYLKPNS